MLKILETPVSTNSCEGLKTSRAKVAVGSVTKWSIRKLIFLSDDTSLFAICHGKSISFNELKTDLEKIRI